MPLRRYSESLLRENMIPHSNEKTKIYFYLSSFYMYLKETIV